MSSSSGSGSLIAPLIPEPAAVTSDSPPAEGACAEAAVGHVSDGTTGAQTPGEGAAITNGLVPTSPADNAKKGRAVYGLDAWKYLLDGVPPDMFEGDTPKKEGLATAAASIAKKVLGALFSLSVAPLLRAARENVHSGGPSHANSQVEGPSLLLRAAVGLLVVLEGMEAAASYLVLFFLGLLTSSFAPDMTAANLWISIVIFLLEGAAKITSSSSALRAEVANCRLLLEHWESTFAGPIRKATRTALKPSPIPPVAPPANHPSKAAQPLRSLGNLLRKWFTPDNVLRIVHAALYIALWVCSLQARQKDLKSYEANHDHSSDFRWYLREYDVLLATVLILGVRYGLHLAVLAWDATLEQIPYFEHDADWKKWLEDVKTGEITAEGQFEAGLDEDSGDIMQKLDAAAQKNTAEALAKVKAKVADDFTLSERTIEDLFNKVLDGEGAKVSPARANLFEALTGKSFSEATEEVKLDAEADVKAKLEGLGEATSDLVDKKLEELRKYDLDDFLGSKDQQAALKEWEEEQKALLLELVKKGTAAVGARLAVLDGEITKTVERHLANAATPAAPPSTAPANNIGTIKIADRQLGATAMSAAPPSAAPATPAALPLAAPATSATPASASPADAASDTTTNTNSSISSENGALSSSAGGGGGTRTVLEEKEARKLTMRKAGRKALEEIHDKAKVVARKDAGVWLAHLRHHRALGGTGAEAAAQCSLPATWFLTPTHLFRLLHHRLPRPDAYGGWDPKAISVRPEAAAAALTGLASFAAKHAFPAGGVPWRGEGAYWSRRYWRLGHEVLRNADPATHGAAVKLMAAHIGGLPGSEKVLRLGGSSNLRALPGLEDLYGLQELDLTDCTNLRRVPDLRGLPALRCIKVGGCHRLQELPGLEDLDGLQKIDLTGCTNLRKVPDLSGLTGLQCVWVGGCTDKLKDALSVGDGVQVHS